MFWTVILDSFQFMSAEANEVTTWPFTKVPEASSSINWCTEGRIGTVGMGKEHGSYYIRRRAVCSRVGQRHAMHLASSTAAAARESSQAHPNLLHLNVP